MNHVAKDYWYVMCREHGAPTVRHESSDSAMREAKRLAKLNVGKTFEVLQLCAEVVMPEPGPMVTFFGDDIPF